MTPRSDVSASGSDAKWEQLLLNGTAEEHLPEPVLPVVVSIRQWNGSTDWRTKRSTLHFVEEHVRSHLIQADTGGGCLWLDETHLLAIIADGDSAQQAYARCHAVLVACGETLMCEIACCIGEPVAAQALGHMVDRLFSLERETVSNIPILWLGYSMQEQNIPTQLLEQWKYLLLDEQYDRLLLHAEQYFAKDGSRIGAFPLHQFNQDFIQMLYSVMAEKHVPAHMLFSRRESMDIFRDAPNSIGNTVIWIFTAVTALSSHLSERRKSQNYTQQARNYIQTHLGSSLTRQDIADNVHLSQNHLARLFRQEVGMSISEYILQERMKLAFGLLENTTLSVGEVALRVGYENYSYFLTLFRRVAGMTPSQYRNHYAGRKPGEGADHE